jgi:hypothetical protein
LLLKNRWATPFASLTRFEGKIEEAVATPSRLGLSPLKCHLNWVSPVVNQNQVIIPDELDEDAIEEDMLEDPAAMQLFEDPDTAIVDYPDEEEAMMQQYLSDDSDDEEEIPPVRGVIWTQPVRRLLLLFQPSTYGPGNIDWTSTQHHVACKFGISPSSRDLKASPPAKIHSAVWTSQPSYRVRLTKHRHSQQRRPAPQRRMHQQRRSSTATYRIPNLTCHCLCVCDLQHVRSRSDEASSAPPTSLADGQGSRILAKIHLDFTGSSQSSR